MKMLKKSDRTLDVYVYIGALVKICKAVCIRLAVDAAKVLDVKERRGYDAVKNWLDRLSIHAESRLRRAYPETEGWQRVYTGPLEDKPRTEVEEAVREAAVRYLEEMIRSIRGEG